MMILTHPNRQWKIINLTFGYNCRIIESSSKYYNCHGYAWHNIEGNMAQDQLRWIDDIDYNYNPTYNVHKYYSSAYSNGKPSYEITINDRANLKVSYFPRDHSAITTSDPQKFISKWAWGPRVEHAPAQCPFYTNAQIKYYRRIPTITGSSSVCPGSSGTYKLNNSPPGSITWTVTNPLFSVSGNSTTATVTTTDHSGQTGTLSAFLNNQLVASIPISSCTPEILGPDLVCCQDEVFKLNFSLPAGYSVVWSCTPNIAPVPYINVTDYTVHCNPNSLSGYGTISALICNDSNVCTTITKQVYVETQSNLPPSSISLELKGRWWPTPGVTKFLIKVGDQYGNPWALCNSNENLKDYVPFCWQSDYGTIVPACLYSCHPKCISNGAWILDTGDSLIDTGDYLIFPLRGGGDVIGDPSEPNLDVAPGEPITLVMDCDGFEAILTVTEPNVPDPFKGNTITVSCTYLGCVSRSATLPITFWGAVMSPPPSYTSTGTGTEKDVIVYPNPASNILNIEVGTQARSQPQESTYDIRLHDAQGNILRQAETKGGNVEFNVSNLLNGIYYLHIYDGINEIPEMRQIIVEH